MDAQLAKARHDSAVDFSYDEKLAITEQLDQSVNEPSTSRTRLCVSQSNISNVREWIASQSEDILSQYHEVELAQWHNWQSVHKQASTRCHAKMVIDLNNPYEPVTFAAGRCCQSCLPGQTTVISEVEAIVEDCYFWAGARRRLSEVLDVVASSGSTAGGAVGVYKLDHGEESE